jgi:hypothetical protein
MTKFRVTLKLLPIIGLTISLALPASADSHPSLKQIMTHLGQAMAHVSDAIWVEDYAAIAKAGGHIGGHNEVSPEQRAQIMQILGKDMPRFKAQDHAAHEAALAMSAAARKQDMPGVLQAYSKVQQACVGCHTAFRGRLKAKP